MAGFAVLVLFFALLLTHPLWALVVVVLVPIHYSRKKT